MYLCVGTLVPTRRYPLIAVPRAQHQHVHTYIGMYIVSLHKVKPVAAATHCFSCFVIAKASNKPLTTQTIFVSSARQQNTTTNNTNNVGRQDRRSAARRRSHPGTTHRWRPSRTHHRGGNSAGGHRPRRTTRASGGAIHLPYR